MRYDRTVLGYHGCDTAVADRLIAGMAFRKSQNNHDWLGPGIYFWEYGADRALRFADEQRRRGIVSNAAVVGAVLQLGNCFDMLDTAFTDELARWYETLRARHERSGVPLPRNAGPGPDFKLRRLDCWILEKYFEECEHAGIIFDTVRCCFPEGLPAYPGSGISRESHIEISVRNPACILGVFRPYPSPPPSLLSMTTTTRSPSSETMGHPTS